MLEGGSSDISCTVDIQAHLPERYECVPQARVLAQRHRLSSTSEYGIGVEQQLHITSRTSLPALLN